MSGVYDAKSDPYVRRMKDRIDREIDHTSFSPLDALGIQRIEAWSLIDRPWRLDVDGIKVADRGSPQAREQATMFAEAIWEAPTFAWGRDILKLAWSLPLPKHIVAPDVLPHSAMVWVMERDWHVSIKDGARLGSARIWMVTAVENGIRVTIPIWREDGHGDYVGTIYATGVGHGDRYPDEVRGLGANLLAMLSFLNSPYVDKIPRRAVPENRAAAKRLSVKPTEVPMVRVVQLRAAVHEARDTGARSSSAKEHDHRWIVRGHHRAQWYPSMTAHRVIWIAPYLKESAGRTGQAAGLRGGPMNDLAAEEARWDAAIARLDPRSQRLIRLAYEGCHKCGRQMGCLPERYLDNNGEEWLQCWRCAWPFLDAPLPSETPSG